jgi:serine/threonine protein kinase
MTASSGDRNPVERLAEEFVERRRHGEHPTITEYVERYPTCADEIRELFPALMLMERLKPAAGDVTGSFVAERYGQAGSLPERLGDFLILREVGRGGMGIVYEAEQESLGRHVALKVLPTHALLNPRHLQRFLREARSAARLHHTNIVPVFGVGEADGLHYYVMQFIAGSGLHEILDRLRLFRAGHPPVSEILGKENTSATASAPEDRDHAHITPQGASGTDTDAFELDNPTERSASHSECHGGATSSTGSEILSSSGVNFAKAVARVGLQVAEALDYAHGQGVLHRDIKPSNLLLDVQGTAWVTDFGLAKAANDGDPLTIDGDILGTLRYMSPERFKGQADARSDIYALGLTLYECLTLRPAFDQADRERLIRQVTTEVPPRPRALNPEIPRDLETVVLKAMEHDPARRYQYAGEMAEDLRRFLSDRPIQARPVGVLERAWKWAKRKPAIASLLAALTVSLIVGFIGVTWQWRDAVVAWDHARRSATNAQTNARHARETVNTFCTLVSEEQLLDQPGMQPLRRQLLELALKYYKTFRTQQGDDRALLKDLAEAAIRSGNISKDLGDDSGAYIAFLQARDILQAQLRNDPGDVSVRLLLARCWIEIEDANRSSDLAYMHAETAIRDFQGRILMEPLVANAPQNLDYLRLLGRSYHMNAWMDIRAARYTESGNHARKAIAILEQVRQSAPEDWEAARWLVAAYSDLPILDRQSGFSANPVDPLGKALAIAEALARRFPKSRRYRLDRARCLIRLGLAQVDLGRFSDAEASFRDADDQFSRLHGDDPDSVELRYGLAVAKRGLGQVALARGASRASVLLRESIAILEPASGRALAGRDLLELAWAYAWLIRAELEEGRRAEINMLQDRLAKRLGAVKERSLVGFPLPNQALEITRIEDLSVSSLELFGDLPTPEQVAAARQRANDRQRRAEKERSNTALRFQFAYGVIELADLLRRNDSQDDVRPFLVSAIPLIEELCKSAPRSLRWKHGLARGLEVLALVESRAGQTARARAAANQAISLARELAEADRVYQYELACALGVQEAVSPSEAGPAKAMAALHQAIDAGFDNRHLLRTDDRLSALRSRPDFPKSP